MRLAGLALAAVLAVVGCSDDGGGRVALPSTSSSLPLPGDATTSASAPDDDALVPVVGGTLRLGIARVSSLDPAVASPESPSSSIVADLLFDGLTRVPSPGAGGGGVAVAEPAVAEGWSTPDGGRTWLFVVSPAARFSDGRSVSAADVEFSLERVVSQGGASLTAARLDVLNGFSEFLTAGGHAAGADLTGVVAVDAATVRIVLDRPMAWLPELLSAPAYGIVSRADGGDPMVSSGPFRLAGRDGDVLSLVRAPARGGYVDQIDLTEHDDLAVALDSFEAGRLDWTLVPASAVDVAAERFGTDGFGPFQAELFFGFNLAFADGRFADVRFRQAIVQAIDRRAIVNAVYFGAASPLATVVPSGVAGADPSRCTAGCAFDPEAARQLLRAAFPAGTTVPTVPLDYADGADEAAVAGIIEQNLAAVGIPVVLRPHPPAEFAAFAVSGEQGMVSLGWIGVGPTPEDYLSRMFLSTSADNLTGFADPGVDTLLGQAAVALDPAVRASLLARAESAVLAAAPTLSLAQFQVLAVAGEGVHDLALGVGGTFDGEAVWLG